jgi:hypothetical protein
MTTAETARGWAIERREKERGRRLAKTGSHKTKTCRTCGKGRERANGGEPTGNKSQYRTKGAQKIEQQTATGGAENEKI